MCWTLGVTSILFFNMFNGTGCASLKNIWFSCIEESFLLILFIVLFLNLNIVRFQLSCIYLWHSWHWVSLHNSSIPLQTLILFSFFLFLSDPTICLPSCIVWLYMAFIAAGNDNPREVLLWLFATVFLAENHMFYNHLNLLLLSYFEVFEAHKL